MLHTQMHLGQNFYKLDGAMYFQRDGPGAKCRDCTIYILNASSTYVLLPSNPAFYYCFSQKDNNNNSTQQSGGYNRSAFVAADPSDVSTMTDWDGKTTG